MEAAFSLHILKDFGLLSILIVISHLLRNQFKILQNIYVPSSIIAGLICLFCGKQFLDIIPFSTNENGMQNIDSYPAFLVVLLFSTIFLGKRKKKVSVKKVIEHATDTFFYNLASLTGQYGFSLLFGLMLLEPLFPALPSGFAILLPVGFAGGHGTATAVSSVLQAHGWEGALSIGYASATVGVLIGVLGGMLVINLGARLGWSRIVQSMQAMPKSMKSGFVPEEEQQSIGQETVHPIALDPLTWHMAIILGTTTIAYLIAKVISIFLGLSVPVFCIALLLGGILQKIFNVIRIGQYIDRHTIHRIGSLVTDYLIGFGIASISIEVVINFALPLILLFAFGTIYTLAFLWFIGPRICKNFWFERSLAIFGWNFGTVATSVMLLRIVDPDMKSPVFEDFSISYFGIAFTEIAIVSLIPILIVNGYILSPALVLIGIFFSCLILSRLFLGWSKASLTDLRPDEKEIINN